MRERVEGREREREREREGKKERGREGRERRGGGGGEGGGGCTVKDWGLGPQNYQVWVFFEAVIIFCYQNTLIEPSRRTAVDTAEHEVIPFGQRTPSIGLCLSLVWISRNLSHHGFADCGCNFPRR